MLSAALRENYRLDEDIATLAAGPYPNPPPLKRGAGIEESPASAFLSPTLSLAATPSPAPLMGAGWGGGDVVGSAARELSSRSGHRDFCGRPPTLTRPH